MCELYVGEARPGFRLTMVGRGQTILVGDYQSKKRNAVCYYSGTGCNKEEFFFGFSKISTNCPLSTLHNSAWSKTC